MVSTAQGPEGLVPSTPQRGPLSTASRLRVQCPVPLVGKHLESQPVSSPAPAGRTMRRARSSLWCVQGRNSLCTPGSYDGRQMRGPFLSYGTCTRETLEGNEGPTGTGPKACRPSRQGRGATLHSGWSLSHRRTFGGCAAPSAQCWLVSCAHSTAVSAQSDRLSARGRRDKGPHVPCSGRRATPQPLRPL